MPNYQNGKIYKLVSNVDNEFYVGSTVQPLAKRKGSHVKDGKRRSDTLVYQHFNNIGWDNVVIVLIENYPCNSKEELFSRERFYIEKLQPTLNRLIPIRTVEEKRTYQKEYHQTDEMKQKMHVYYLSNADQIKNRAKQYYADNAEAIKLRRKQRYEEECKQK